jgi:hypothetical protein
MPVASILTVATREHIADIVDKNRGAVTCSGRDNNFATECVYECRYMHRCDVKVEA